MSILFSSARIKARWRDDIIPRLWLVLCPEGGSKRLSAVCFDATHRQPHGTSLALSSSWSSRRPACRVGQVSASMAGVAGVRSERASPGS